VEEKQKTSKRNRGKWYNYNKRGKRSLFIGGNKEPKCTLGCDIGENQRLSNFERVPSLKADPNSRRSFPRLTPRIRAYD